MGQMGDELLQAPPIQVLTGCPPNEAVLFLIIVTMVLFTKKLEGTNVRGALIVLVKGIMQIATLKQFLLLYAFGKMINGVHANDQNEEVVQICICADPDVWEASVYALKAAVVTLLAGLLVFGIVNRPPPVPAVPEAAPAIPEAALALQEAAPTLPIYPAVQGDDIDAVLENAPVATRRNSPLESWL